MSEATTPPPSTALTPPAPPAPVPQIPVQIQELPPQLEKLLQQVQLLAKVLWQKPDGTALLQTPKGEITVKTEIPLPVGRSIPVTLPLPQGAAPLRELFLSLPRAAQPPLPAPSLPLPASAVIVSGAPAAAPVLPPLRPGAIIAAQPLFIEENFDIPLLQKFSLPVGQKPVVVQPQALSNLVQQVKTSVQTAFSKPAESFFPTNIGRPAPSPGAAPKAPLTDTLIALQSAPVSSPLPLNKAPEQIAPKLQFFNIVRTEPSTPAMPAPPAQLTATVKGATLQGQPIVAIPGKGVFILQTSTPLPAGTQIVLQSAPAPQMAAIPDTKPLIAIPTPEGEIVLPVLDPATDGEWPVLDETLRNLAQISPQAAASIRANLPSPATSPAQLPSSSLFFLAAMKSGILENWIGPANLDALRQSGRQGIIDALRSDFTRIGRQAAEAITAGDWRVLSMPMNHDNQISQIQIFVRQQPYESPEREGGGKQEAGNKKQTRFVLNFGLSRLGPMQLDGLLRRTTLDLIVRTDRALDSEMRQEIRKRFASGLEQVNLSGEIAFHSNRKGWISVTEPSARAGITA